MCNHFQSPRFCKWWTVRPKTTNIFPSFFTKQYPELIKSIILPLFSPDVFVLTFPLAALHLLGPLSWPHTPPHFYRTYRFPHLDSIIIFLIGRMQHLLLWDVCFHLEIWTVPSAHRPVIREVCDNENGDISCHSSFLFSECVFFLNWVALTK